MHLIRHSTLALGAKENEAAPLKIGLVSVLELLEVRWENWAKAVFKPCIYLLVLWRE